MQTLSDMPLNKETGSLPMGNPDIEYTKSINLRLAVAGIGNVGLSFLKRVSEKWASGKIDIVVIADSSGYLLKPEGFNSEELNKIVNHKNSGYKLSEKIEGFSFYTNDDFETILAKKLLDVLVEMGPTDFRTGGKSLDRILVALKAGLDVVSASKGPFVARQKDGKPTLDLIREHARQNNNIVRYSATVGAGTPMLDTGRIFALGNPVIRIEAVLNGTSSLVLGLMENGFTIDESLSMARDAGMTEADSWLDTSGMDAAIKLSILCPEIMDCDLPVDKISLESIEEATPERFSAAAKKGMKLRSVAVVEKQKDLSLKGSICLKEVPVNSPLAVSEGKNAIIFTSVHAGQIGLIGKGAGPSETACAVLRDVLIIYNQRYKS